MCGGVGGVWLLFYNVKPSVLTSFTIICLRKTEFVALHVLKFCSCCHLAVRVLCLFLVVPWVGL